MKNIITRAIAVLCLASACFGDATAPSPERWVRYDLELPVGQSVTTDILSTDTNTTDIVLEKRRHVDICQKVVAITAGCLTIGNGIKNIAVYISNVIYDLSHKRSCGTFTSTIGNVRFRYQANGRDCDTTAQQATIAGAVLHHMKTVDGGKLCGMTCLNLSHGGTWDGYLLLGPANNFDATVFCGPKLHFDKCSNGGKEDLK